MTSELKTFRNNFTHFRTYVVMTVEFNPFPANYNRDISLDLLVAKRTKLRQHLGLKNHHLFHFIKPPRTIRPMRVALSQSAPGLDRIKNKLKLI